MKTTIITAAIMALFTTTAFAQGTPSNWTGPYAGVNYGQTTLTEYEEIEDSGENEEECYRIFDFPCFDGIFQPKYTVSKTSENFTGGFAGYRQAYDQVVFGGEIGVNGDLKSLEAQVGLNTGALLPYAFYGVGQFDGADTGTYGVGADLKVTTNMFVGAKFTQGDFGEQATVRVGFNF